MFLFLKEKLSYLFYAFLNFIYNQKCIICACGKTDEILCKNCLKSVNYLSTFPHKIYNNIPIYSACLYDGIIKTLIHKLKFQHKKKAAIALALILFKYFKQLKLNDDFIIVYPESFYLKSATRGYNHALLIVKEFSKLTNITYLKNTILKIKYTKPQYKAKNRYSNIKNSFKINEKYISQFKNKTILLIDDITTSGATLEEIINCFLSQNITNIICLTISKSIK